MNSEQIYIRLENKRRELGLIFHIGMIQSRGGFRVSEVLKMDYNNIINDTDIFILADKGSRSRRVHLPELRDDLVKWRLNKLCPFKNISRFQVYRAYKSMGIVLQNGKGKNNSVTHAMRKNYVRDSYKSSNSIGVAADLVGHKSIKSTEYYVEKESN